jgi:hypothetical protein
VIALIGSLLRGITVEVLVVGLRGGAGVVDDAVPVIRRRIERVELQGNAAGVDDVVIRPRRDEDREARLDRRPNSSLGFNAMTTSWVCLAVYSTRRNSAFFTARPSMSCTKPFMTTPLSVAAVPHETQGGASRAPPCRV